MTKILEHLGPEPIKATPECRSCPVVEAVKAIAYALLDCLKVVGYALKAALYALSSVGSSSKSIFKGEIHTKSGNYSKFTEIFDYISKQRHPEQLPEEVNPIFSKHGFTKSKTDVSPQFSAGLCQGGSTVFCKRWLTNSDDSHPDFSDFKGGVPIEGAFYQEAYTTLFRENYYPDLSKAIQRGDKQAPRQFVNAQPIFDARNALPEGNADQIQAWTIKNCSTRFGGRYLASLRDATGYQNIDLDRTKACFELAGLSTEVLNYRSSSKDVLENIDSLEPGVYNLSLPVYNAIGNREEGLHTVAFVIQEGQPAYFYDANLCIASAGRDQVQATIGRLFTFYTGLDYSTNLDGEMPSLGRRVFNFIQERANPPSEPVEQAFELIRVTAASPAHPPRTTA